MKIINNKVHVSVDDINQSINGIKNRLDNDVKLPDIIVCLTRGGLVPTGIISYKLGIKDIITLQISSYTDDNKQGKLDLTGLSDTDIKKLKDASNILVVDDIIDTGHTIDAVMEYFKEIGNDELVEKTDLFTVVNKSKKYKKAYSIFEKFNDERWIVFEWDK